MRGLFPGTPSRPPANETLTSDREWGSGPPHFQRQENGINSACMPLSVTTEQAFISATCLALQCAKFSSTDAAISSVSLKTRIARRVHDGDVRICTLQQAFMVRSKHCVYGCSGRIFCRYFGVFFVASTAWYGWQPKLSAHGTSKPRKNALAPIHAL